ncbi:MAG: restriction endonuclease subunit S [Colwellia sp.]
MAGKYQAYPEYKKSSVGILGEIPSEWEVLRYKNVLKIMQGMAFKSSEYVDASSVVNIRMGNIKKGGDIDLKHNNKYLPENYKGLYGAYELYEGDAIIAMTDMSPTLDFLAVPAILEGLDENTSYLLNQRVGKLLLDKKFDIRFIRYLLLSDELRTQLKAKGLGTVQANMSNDDLYSSYFFCPSSKERLKIVDFLDHETAKIDSLIETQQRLIKLLNEKRQAVISHAVTKGLNPNAPMRDSGVEWLGDVPEHWDVVAIKHIVSTPVTDGPHETPEFLDEGVPFISAEAVSSGQINFDKIRAHISEEDNQRYSLKYSPKKYDIYMVKSGATTGVTAIVETDKKFNIWSPLAVIRCKEESYPYFVLNFMRSYNFKEAVELNWSFGTQQNIGMGVIENLHITRPPIAEAKEISEKLVEQCDVYDSVIDKASSQIDLMQERRAALISAAITGRIDVRNWQAPEPSDNQSKEEAA